MKKHLLLSIFMLPVYLTAQSVHDLKVDVIGLFDRNYQLYYEWMPQQRIGVEVGLQYLRTEVLLDTSRVGELFSFAVYDQSFAGLTLSGRYYFSASKAGQGFFGGLYQYTKYRLYLDPEYERIFTDKYGAPVGSPWEEVALGVQAGYKWLLWERLVIDLLAGVDTDLIFIFDDSLPGTFWNSFASLRLGYRFGAGG